MADMKKYLSELVDTSCDTEVILEAIVGLVLTGVGDECVSNVIRLEFGDYVVEFYHEQNCCESVLIDDINGDFKDLVGHPLLVADERTNHEETNFGSETWTFYTFRGVNGSVDVKWYGESNGYYSEEVYARVLRKKNKGNTQ